MKRFRDDQYQYFVDKMVMDVGHDEDYPIVPGCTEDEIAIEDDVIEFIRRADDLPIYSRFVFLGRFKAYRHGAKTLRNPEYEQCQSCRGFATTCKIVSDDDGERSRLLCNSCRETCKFCYREYDCNLIMQHYENYHSSEEERSSSEGEKSEE
jgi:hypothetical protein